MSLGPIRPRFKMVAAGTVPETIARLEAAAGDPAQRCVSRTVDHHVDITVVPEDRHRWSPCVQLELRASSAETPETIVDGLIGPHPSTWTLFLFANAAILLLAGFGLMLGIVQLQLGGAAWGLWSVPAGALLLVLMYVASQVGRRMAAEQTRQLMGLVEAAVEG